MSLIANRSALSVLLTGVLLVACGDSPAIVSRQGGGSGGNKGTGGGTASRTGGQGGGSSSRTGGGQGGGTWGQGGGAGGLGGGGGSLGGGAGGGAGGGTGTVRNVVMCLTGAGASPPDQTASSNRYFSQLCDDLKASGATVIQSCTSSTCYTSFATSPTPWIFFDGAPLAKLIFAQLDVNKDGRVTSADGLQTLTVVGFSWGGINAEPVVVELSDDSRIDHASLTMRLVVLDAYQPVVGAVDPPVNSDESYSFRHLIAPSNDCSNGSVNGPYLGLRLRCPKTQKCYDYNFSAAPTQVFNGLTGASVGHCDVPQAAAPYVKELVFSGKITSALPPSVPVNP